MDLTILDFQSLIVRYVRPAMAALHAELWSRWNMDQCGAAPAHLCVCSSEGTSGYDIPTDTIYIFLPEGNRNELVRWLNRHKDEFVAPCNWCIAEMELVHETLHEYQNKFARTVTKEGHQLFEDSRYRSANDCHDEWYFTIIANKAGTFGVTADELAVALNLKWKQCGS